MISYATVGSNDLPKAISFYTELLGTQGLTKLFDHPSGGAIFGKDGQMSFGVLGPYNGQPATAGNGTMIAMALPSREAVDAFYAKALELGGSCEGAPGERGPGYYMSYFRDLDGNKLCAHKFG